MKFIKNISGLTKNYDGQDILDNEYQLIPISREIYWSSDNNLLIDISNGDVIVAKDDSGTKDITNISDAINYLKNINKEVEIDDEGRQTVRRATAKKGWHYSAITAEIETSTLGTYNKDYNGVDLGYVTVKLYKADNTEITDQTVADADCVKTVVTIKPDYDFEIIEGDIYHHTRPTDNIRLWTLAGIPELGAAGTKVFVNGLNLKFMSPDDHIESDGRSSKFMSKIVPGIPYQGNQFQFILKHPAGCKHELMVLLECYKE
jgi:hypothetical protein